MTRLTVVIPNYNHGFCVGASLDSVFGNSRPPDEVIVIDDGSTDDSWAVLEDYAEHEPRLSLYRNDENRGVIYTLNRGLELAHGEFVHFGSADDIVDPALYEKSLALLSQHPRAGLCSAIVRWVSPKGETILLDPVPGTVAQRGRSFTPAQALSRLRRKGPWYAGPTAVWRRQAVIDCDGFHPDLGAFTDGFLFQIVACKFGACFVPEVLGDFLVKPGSVSSELTADPETCARRMATAVELMRNVHRGVFPRAFIRRTARRARYVVRCNRIAAVRKYWFDTCLKLPAPVAGRVFGLACIHMMYLVTRGCLLLRCRPGGYGRLFGRLRGTLRQTLQTLRSFRSRRRQKPPKESGPSHQDMLAVVQCYRGFCQEWSQTADRVFDRGRLADSVFRVAVRIALPTSAAMVYLFAQAFRLFVRVRRIGSPSQTVIADGHDDDSTESRRAA